MIDRRSLKAIALEKIRGSILRGTLKPGRRITEIGLARALGVGQGTIREALIELEYQGLVQKQGSRKMIRGLTARDIEEIYEVRSQLEGFAITRLGAADAATRLHDAETACQEMFSAAQTEALERFWQADLRFHRALWRATGNQHLVDCLERLVGWRFALVIIRRRRPDRSGLEAIASGHQELLRLILAGEIEEAKTAMMESMHRARANDLEWAKELG